MNRYGNEFILFSVTVLKGFYDWDGLWQIRLKSQWMTSHNISQHSFWEKRKEWREEEKNRWVGTWYMGFTMTVIRNCSSHYTQSSSNKIIALLQWKIISLICLRLINFDKKEYSVDIFIIVQLQSWRKHSRKKAVIYELIAIKKERC